MCKTVYLAFKVLHLDSANPEDYFYKIFSLHRIMADTENGEQESFNVESTVDTIGVPGNDESVDDPVSVFSVSLSPSLPCLASFFLYR